MIIITFTNTNGYYNKRNTISFFKAMKILGVIKGVNRITC